MIRPSLERIAAEIAGHCPVQDLEHAAGYCVFTEAADIIAASDGPRLVPDARERLARMLWRADAGSDSAWPFAGSLRDPFYEIADRILAMISAPSGRAE